MKNEFTYYKVSWFEEVFEHGFGYSMNKEKQFYQLYEAREFKEFLKRNKITSEIKKITVTTEIII